MLRAGLGKPLIGVLTVNKAGNATAVKGPCAMSMNMTVTRMVAAYLLKTTFVVAASTHSLCSM